MHPDLPAELNRIVGPDHVLAEPGLIRGYTTDWTGRYRGSAALVVRPGTPAEVAAILRACATAGAGVVPQGGNTSLVGGATPSAGQVVLSTTRLDSLGPVDAAEAAVTVGAGATLGAVRAHVAPFGLVPAVDLASRDSATIGGMVATDAGGIHVVRHGSMRRQVLALEAVLADGTIVGRADRPVTAGGGLDLPALLAGSEGTLAVVTAVRLRLVPAWRARATALVAFDGVGAAVAATHALRARLPDLDAVELVDRAGIELGLDRGLAPPFTPLPPVCLLVETAADRSTVDELAASLDRLPGVVDALLADDGPGRRRLWAFREELTETIAALGVPHKLDVGLPLEAVEPFVDALGPLVHGLDPGARVIVFGHLAVGNLHVNVLGPGPEDERVDDAILALVIEHGGSIAAEHGIGRAKARWLTRARPAWELALQAAIKQALDPAGILNPGVLDPAPTNRADGHAAPAGRPGPDGR